MGELSRQSYLRLTSDQAASFFRALSLSTCQVQGESNTIVWWFSAPPVRIEFDVAGATDERPFRFYVQERRCG